MVLARVRRKRNAELRRWHKQRKKCPDEIKMGEYIVQSPRPDGQTKQVKKKEKRCRCTCPSNLSFWRFDWEQRGWWWACQWDGHQWCILNMCRTRNLWVSSREKWWRWKDKSRPILKSRAAWRSFRVRAFLPFFHSPSISHQLRRQKTSPLFLSHLLVKGRQYLHGFCKGLSTTIYFTTGRGFFNAHRGTSDLFRIGPGWSLAMDVYRILVHFQFIHSGTIFSQHYCSLLSLCTRSNELR